MENYQRNKKGVLDGRLTWNSVMNRLAQKFTNLKLYTKEDLSTEEIMRQRLNNKTNNIVKSKHLFKGNTLNIYNSKKVIGISNSYYSNHLTQEYDIETGITTMRYGTFTKRGKWVSKLLKDYTNKFVGLNRPNLNTFRIDLPHELFKEHLNSKTIVKAANIHISEWGDVQLHFDVEYKDKGNFNFQNNWQNIDDLKRLNKIQSYVLNTIKKNPSIIIDQPLKMCKDLYYYHLSITKNNLINN